MTILMVTGPRKVENTTKAFEQLEYILDKASTIYPNLTLLTGGAAGIDMLAAKAAHTVNVPYIVEFPHKDYAKHYKLNVDSLVAQAHEVSYTCLEPEFKFWMNFSRNKSMATKADQFLIASAVNPKEMTEKTKGGTAQAVSEIKKVKPAVDVIWLNLVSYSAHKVCLTQRLPASQSFLR